MSTENKKYLLGIFGDEDVLIGAVKSVRAGGVKIEEVYTPFPVHGLEHALGYRDTRLTIVAFLFGITGTGLALLMQIWMMGYDWPMIIGGKPYVPLPSFIPVTFEVTVLLASLGMVGVFLIVADLRPNKRPKMLDVRSTDDKHVMAIDVAKNTFSLEDIRKILLENGAEEVNEKEVA